MLLTCSSWQRNIQSSFLINVGLLAGQFLPDYSITEFKLRKGGSHEFIFLIQFFGFKSF